MNLRPINPGDRVQCNVKGRVFWATVEGKEDGALRVEPDSRNVTWRVLRARQVLKREPAARFDHAKTHVTRGP